MRLELSLAGPENPSSNETERLQIEAGLRLQFRRKRATPAPAAAVEILTKHSLSGDGWMPPEPAPASASRWVRWSGPGTSSELWVDLDSRQDGRVAFYVLQVMKYAVIATLRMEVNGHAVELDRHAAPMAAYPHAFRFEGVIPVAVLAAEPGLTRIVLTVAETFQEPSPSEPALGPKQLGFCVERFIFTAGPVPAPFDPVFYLGMYADVAAQLAGDEAQVSAHWEQFGRAEGRLGAVPSFWDHGYYAQKNPDVLATVGADRTRLWLHCFQRGVAERREVAEEFHPSEYLGLNPDLAAAFGSDLPRAFLHWYQCGRQEMRQGRLLVQDYFPDRVVGEG